MLGGHPERPVKVGGPNENWVKPKKKGIIGRIYAKHSFLFTRE
jgi:hypothetical protein